MKTYSYRIIGTSITEDTNLNTLREVKKHIKDFFGQCKFEYWGKTSGNAKVS